MTVKLISFIMFVMAAFGANAACEVHSVDGVASMLIVAIAAAAVWVSSLGEEELI